MSGHKRILVLVLAAVLALTSFPFPASAAGEDILEPAPEVILPEETPVPETDTEDGTAPLEAGPDEPVTEYTFYEDPYLPSRYGRLYSDDAEETDDPWYTGPYLEPSEYRRAMELLAAVEAGEQSLAGIRCPVHENEVKIGVWPLDPGDFNGETYYIMIPQRKLEDRDLLYLISCFRKLGIPFEPKEWNSRNCLRGSYANRATRDLSQEESIRMAALRHLTANGMLTDADIHPETECKSIMTLFGPFCFYPYRRMTDDELAAFALARDPAWPNAPDEVEKAAREFIADYIRLPLSMKLDTAELSWSPRARKIEGYTLTFRIEYTDAYGNVLRTGGKPCEVDVYLRRRLGDGAVIGCSATVRYYSDFTVLAAKEYAEPLSKEEIYGIGKQWLLDTLGLDETKYAWWNEENFAGSFYSVWADNSDREFNADVYPDGSIEQFCIRDLKLPGNFIGDVYDEETHGTPPVSLEELLEQATQAPPEAARPAETVQVPEDLSGMTAGEVFRPSEDPYFPDYNAPDYEHPEKAQDEEWMYIRSWLEPEELARANALKAAVEAGERSVEDLSYPEHPDELKAGVYPLDPAEFGGEMYYVTLPGRKLKDYDLLYLISCFEQLGIPFEPENWNSRNCMRGYYTRGSNRDLSEEEQARMELLLKQVRYGELTEKDVHPDTECRSVDTWFGPLCFYPYRQMTDDELAAFALVRDSAWEDDPDEVERIARKFAAEIVKLPPVMKLSESDRSRISYSDLTEGYGMTFRTENTEGNEAAADGRPCEVYVYLRKRQDNGALRGEGVRVGYDFDYESLFFREEGASLSEAELLETGKQWCLDHLVTDVSSYSFRIEKTGWSDDYRWVETEPADWSWHYYVTLASDGTVESFNAQKMQ